MTNRWRVGPLTFWCALLVLLMAPTQVHAQWPSLPWHPPPPPPETAPDARPSELRYLGWNALLGGIGAGVAALVREESVAKAFVKGAAGGAVVYGGKRIAVERWFGAGLIGRQVGLVGGSMINNAGASRGMFDRVALGFGPVRGYLDREIDGVEWGVDVPAVGAVVRGLVDSDARLDWTGSLSSGAVVFDRSGPNALPGTIYYWQESGWAEYYFAHERVHVLQYDQLYLSVGEPIDAWIGQIFPDLGMPFNLEFNASGLAALIMLYGYIWPKHGEEPWENEAGFLGDLRWER